MVDGWIKETGVNSVGRSLQIINMGTWGEKKSYGECFLRIWSVSHLDWRVLPSLRASPGEQGDFSFSHRSEATALLTAYIPSGSLHADTLVCPTTSSCYLDQE